MTFSEIMHWNNLVHFIMYTKEASTKYAFIADCVWGLINVNHTVLAKGNFLASLDLLQVLLSSELFL